MPQTSVLKRGQVQNLSCVNDFLLSCKKKPTNFHKKGFALGLVLSVMFWNSEMAYFSLSTLLIQGSVYKCTASPMKTSVFFSVDGTPSTRFKPNRLVWVLQIVHFLNEELLF